ncbi:porin [Alphaproteobacteria bacterium]|nr:porin [Alphaproteobacteria bacterium]
MRKVLLATTALVAMSVTAAQADISLSGNYEWEYQTDDDGTAFKDDGHLNVTAVNAADNGMTFTTYLSFEAGSTNSGMESAYVKVGGDFGTIILGDMDDSAATSMDGALGNNNDIETQVGLGDASTTVGIGGAADITYKSPNISGFQLGLSKDVTDADAVATDGKADMIVTYSMGGISGHYASSDDKSNFGVKGSVAGFTIAVGSMKESGTTVKANDIAVKYTLGNGITLAALSANGTSDTGTKTKASNFGASYSIVPGVKLGVESGKVGTENYSWVAVNMSF